MAPPQRLRDLSATRLRAGRVAVVALTVGIAAVTTPGRCVAAPLSLAIDAERTPAAADCTSEAKLLAKVERIAQRPLAPHVATEDVIHVNVYFDRSGGEYRAVLEFRGPKPGERTLSDPSPTCEPLEDAAAVAIALVLDAEIEQRERAAVERLRAEPTIKIIRAEVEPKAAKSTAFEANLELGALSGFNSKLTEWVAIGLGWRPFAGWIFESNAWATLPASTGYGSGVVDVSLVAGGARVCRLWGTSLQWGPCAGMALGRLHGEGRGFDDSMSSNLLWWALDASLLVQRPISQNWDVGVHAFGWVLPEERLFVVQNAGIAWNSARIVPGLSVRLGFRF